MYSGIGTVRVSASIDIHEDTDMRCVVSADSGDVEVRLGVDADAYLFLTGAGADKLVHVLSEARGQ
jgi:hypothetical protein